MAEVGAGAGEAEVGLGGGGFGDGARRLQQRVGARARRSFFAAGAIQHQGAGEVG